MEARGVVWADLADYDIWEGAAPYWRAYTQLVASRGTDMGEPIPLRWSDVLAYAEAFGFAQDRTDLEEFCELISAMDQTELRYRAEHRPRPAR